MQKFVIKLVMCAMLALPSCGTYTLFSGPTATPLNLQDIAFATAVPVSEMNTKIKLRLASEFNEDLKIDSAISFWVENQTREAVWFPFDYGIKTFVYSNLDKDWEEVKNKVIYSPQKDQILDPKGKGEFWQHVVDARPDVPNIGQPITVRVIVTGRMYIGTKLSNDEVAAFTDVTLQP